MFSLKKIPNQLPGEQVIMIIRKDGFILFMKVMQYFLVFILPLGLLFLIYYNNPGVFTNDLSFSFVVVGASIYYLFTWLMFFMVFLDFYLDIWIVTSDRILNIEHEGFFSRTVSEVRIDNVQDVTSDVQGIMPTIFNFGSVKIQTAAEVERFHFDEVPDPEGIRNAIIRLAESKGKIGK